MFTAEPEATQVMDTAVGVFQQCVYGDEWEVGHKGLATDLKGFSCTSVFKIVTEKKTQSVAG